MAVAAAKQHEETRARAFFFIPVSISSYLSAADHFAEIFLSSTGDIGGRYIKVCD
jgi:hypothetical protein